MVVVNALVKTVATRVVNYGQLHNGSICFAGNRVGVTDCRVGEKRGEWS